MSQKDEIERQRRQKCEHRFYKTRKQLSYFCGIEKEIDLHVICEDCGQEGIVSLHWTSSDITWEDD